MVKIIRVSFYLLLYALFVCFFTSSPLKVNAREMPSAGDDTGGLPEFRVGVKVDLVTFYASVFDKNNHFIPELGKKRFRVVEDGVEQDIEYFTRENVPLSMGIVLDLSGSMSEKIEQMRRAALTFLEVSSSGDEFFLVGFKDDVKMLQDYTNDIAGLSEALALGNTMVAGNTRLYDAIYMGVEKAQAGANPKKALVVITDGIDTKSRYNLKELLSKIQESDVQVFCIGLMQESLRGSLKGVLTSINITMYL